MRAAILLPTFVKTTKARFLMRGEIPTPEATRQLLRGGVEAQTIVCRSKDWLDRLVVASVAPPGGILFTQPNVTTATW